MESWRQSESSKGLDNLEDRMVHVLNTAGEAMFVTSITTSAAFFANAVNYITSIKCFGLYW
jgi:protein dispatched 1